MNLLSLVTLQKLNKLEILSLSEITEMQWEYLGNEWRDMWFSINAYITKHELFGMTEFFVFFPCTPITESTPNPNRFVKSSFALSLLWVAHYFNTFTATLRDFDLKRNTHNQFLAYKKSYESLRTIKSLLVS